MRWVGLTIIILAIPLFVALLGGSVQRRNWAMIMLGVLVFIVGFRAPEAAIYVWPAWQGIAKGVFVTLADSIAIALLVTRPPGRYRTVFMPAFLFYFLMLAVSFIPSINKAATLFVAVQFLQMLILFVAVAGELQRPEAVRSLLKGLSIGLMYQAAYVIRAKLGGAVQASGTLGHQNILGMMVELALVPLAAAVLEGERNKLIYAGVVAGGICVAGTGSRGTMGFVALALVLLVLLSLLRNATRRKWQMLGAGTLVAAVIVPLSLATLTERFGSASFSFEETARITLARAAVAMAADHPLGVGANNFVTVSNVGGYLTRAGEMQTQATSARPAHNAYLVARAETGWGGEIALIAIMVTLVGGGMVVAFRYRRVPEAGIALGASVAVLAVALHSQYEYAWHTTDVQRLFFIDAALIVGLLAIARKRRASPASAGRPPARKARGGRVERPSPAPDLPASAAPAEMVPPPGGSAGERLPRKRP